MENSKRTIKIFVQMLLISILLSGCASTFVSEDGERDQELHEQKNLEIAYGFLVNGYPFRAIERLQEILKVNPDSAKAYGMLGVVYKAQGELELAKQNFKKSLKMDPTASDVRNNYGVLLFEEGDYTGAQKEFLKVTEDVYYTQRSRAFENLGIVDLRLNNEEGAKAHFERALRLDHNLPVATFELAEILFDARDYVASEGYYQSYLAMTKGMRPSASGLWLGIQLAKVFEQTEQMKGYIDQLSRFYPESAEYREYLASLKKWAKQQNETCGKQT